MKIERQGIEMLEIDLLPIFTRYRNAFRDFSYAMTALQKTVSVTPAWLRAMEEDMARFIGLTETFIGTPVTADLIATVQAWHREAPVPPTLEGAPWQSFKTALSITLEETR